MLAARYVWSDKFVSTWERICELHGILRDRRHPVSTATLLDELDCSRSTLHRIVVHLRDRLRAPIENDPGRGYYYDRNAGKFELPGLWFRADELEALLVMDHLLQNIQPGMLHDRLAKLQGRVKKIMDAGLGGGRQFPAHRIRILRSHARQIDSGQLIPVASAVVERLQLAFTYEGRSSGDISRRALSPQRLVFYRDQWYLDGWDEDKNALRTFSVDRMKDIGVLEEIARDVPDEQLNAALTAGYGLFAGPVRNHARLVFSAVRARWVADET